MVWNPAVLKKHAALSSRLSKGFVFSARAAPWCNNNNNKCALPFPFPVYQQPRGAGMCPHHRCQTQNRFLDAPSYLASGSPVTFSSPLLLSRLFKRFSPFLLLTLLRISFRNDRVGGSGRREDGWLDGEEAERAEERKPLKWRNLGPCSRGPDLCRFQGSVRLTRWPPSCNLAYWETTSDLSFKIKVYSFFFRFLTHK